MLNFIESVNKLKTKLLDQFNIVDTNILAAVQMLEDNGFPSCANFKTIYELQIQGCSELILGESAKYQSLLDQLKLDDNFEDISCHLAGKYRLSRQKELCDKYQNCILEAHTAKYKFLCQQFAESVFSQYLQIAERDGDLPASLFGIVEWLMFGLENLCSASYSVVGIIGDWLSNKSNPQALSIWQQVKSSTTQSIMSKMNVYDNILGTIFDIKRYIDILKCYVLNCKKLFEKIPSIEFVESFSANSISSNDSFFSDSLSNLLSSGVIDVNKILEKLPTQKDRLEKLNNVALRVQSEQVFIISLFCEIKEFISLIKSSAVRVNLEEIQKIMQIVTLAQKKNQISDVSRFVINECYNWLSGISEKNDLNELQPLVYRYLKLINVLQLVDVNVSEIIGVPGLEDYLKEIAIVKAFLELENINKIKNRFSKCYPETNAEIKKPVFEGYTKRNDMSIQGGSQEKAPGTGFYIEEKSAQSYFIKRTTKLHLIADDICEILASSLAEFFGSNAFAHCKPIRSSANVVYIASACSVGFKPLFDMKGRLTTRLLPHEREAFLSSLPPEIANELREIIFISALLGDTDPNPGNVGSTISGIKKIDHGWAFDQICSSEIATWHDNLNPMRYPGRFAPTNALCDYAILFKETDCDFMEKFLTKCSDKNVLLEFVLSVLQQIMQAYVGSYAMGSLKDEIEELDILKALCQRFGLRYQSENLNDIAFKLSEALNVRANNLYLISMLEQIHNTSSSTADYKLWVPVIAQYNYMLLSNIHLSNFKLIEKLCNNIKARTTDKEIQNRIDSILDKAHVEPLPFNEVSRHQATCSNIIITTIPSEIDYESALDKEIQNRIDNILDKNHVESLSSNEMLIHQATSNEIDSKSTFNAMPDKLYDGDGFVIPQIINSSAVSLPSINEWSHNLKCKHKFRDNKDSERIRKNKKNRAL